MNILGTEWDIPRVILWCFIIVIAVTLSLAALTSTTAFGAYNAEWDGTSELRNSAADSASATPVLIDSTEYDQLEGSGTLVILLAPQTAYSPAEQARVDAFLDRGGTLLIADDRRGETNQLLAELGVSTRIDGRQLRDPNQFHRNPALPIITNTSNTSITQGVDQFTFNRGSTLTTGNATVLAYSSDFSYLDENENEQRDQTEPLQSYPVLTTEQVGNGRVFVLSDPSIFINQMLDRPGNRNLANGLTSSYDRVVLDSSHGGKIPLTIQFWVWLKQTPWAQAVLAGLGPLLLGLAVHPRVRSVITIVREEFFERDTSLDAVTFDAEERTEYLRHQHPDWDATRVERITKSMEQLDTDTISDDDE
ncbi:protein of unknown function [Halopenitus malekzadehii]|uniref:DUF4350 domain-containing protein n=1 Tax=Halopenitus malekzadehii TaxID=1267564 RepID=A0A1H6IAN1_9EURY|nr:protein of unknown function [Halopenitus malekzadehii]